VAERGHISIEDRMTIRLASTFCIHQSVEVVDMLYEAAGSGANLQHQPVRTPVPRHPQRRAAIAGAAAAFRDRRRAHSRLETDTSWL